MNALKYLLFILPFAFFSCKEPVPVYHTALPGKAIDSFPYKVCGTWIGIDDVIKRELNQMQSWFPANPEDMRFVEADTTFKAPQDTAKNPLLAFNKQGFEMLLKPIDSLEGIAKRKIKVGVIRIIPKGFDFEFMDSLGQRGSIPLFRVDAKTKIIPYKEDYFLARQCNFGWEIIMLDMHTENLASIRIPWFTDYDEHAKTPKLFQQSLRSTSPKLKPLLNKEGKIIGVTTAMKPEEVVELLKKSNTEPINLHRY